MKQSQIIQLVSRCTRKLVLFEIDKQISFTICCVYWIYDVLGGEQRGGLYS